MGFHAQAKGKPKIFSKVLWKTALEHIEKEGEPSPLRGEGKGPAPRRVQDKALNLLWFRGGGERPDGRGKKTQEIFYGYRAAFMEVSQRHTDRRFQVSPATTHPSPSPSPARGEGR